MCYAGNCHPECDNCQPKYVICAQCKERTFIERNSCIVCGHEITDNDRSEAKELWKKTHIGKNIL